MRFIRIITTLIFIVWAGGAVASSREEAANNAASLLQEIKTVSLCELAHNPILYDKKIVRIRATLVENHAPRVDGGDPFLFDLSCYSDDTLIYASFVELNPSYKFSVEIQKAFEYSERSKDKYSNSRADVIAIGRYDAPNGMGYGHLNWARSQFGIMRYEEVKPVNSNTPWFWQVKKQPAPLNQVEELIREKDTVLQFYILGVRNNAPEVEKTLAQDYMLTDSENPSGNRTEVIAPAAAAIGKLSNTIQSLRIYGDTAVVTGQSKRCNQKDSCETFRYMNVYAKRENSWQAVASHLVLVK